MTVQIDHSTNAITATAGSVTVNGSAPATTTLTVSNKTGAYSVVAGDNGTIIRTTSGTGAITLPSCAAVGSGFNFYYVNNTSGNVSVSAVGSDTFTNGATTIYVVTPGQNYRIAVVDASATGKWQLLDTGIQGNASRAQSYGYGATASGGDAVAIGNGATASSNSSTALGQSSTGQGSQAVTGSGAMALGGSYASGTDAFAAAIGDNTGTYGAKSTYAIAVGHLAAASAQGAIALGAYGIVTVPTAATSTSAVAIGDGCTASGSGSYAIGVQASAAQNRKYAYSGGQFAAVGDAQYGLMVLRIDPASGATGVLTSNGAAANTTNQLVVASGQAMTVTGMIVGKVTATAQVYSATFTAQLINNGGTCTLGAAVTLANVTDGITLTTIPTVTADNTNKALAVTSGAKTATVIKWVCTVQSCEITY